MYYKLLFLIMMVFLHIVDDYYLQGILASMKQKDWWKQNAPDKKYENDYIVALIIHSFSWSFMIMIIPAIISLRASYQPNTVALHLILVFVCNMFIHATIDHKKANLKQINLIQDQIIHLTQIAFTWFLFII